MSNNLKQLGLGLHNAADMQDSFVFQDARGGGFEIHGFINTDDGGEAGRAVDLGISDGTSNTATIGGPHVKVFDGSTADAAGDGSAHSGGANVLLADGSVRFAMGDGSVRFVSDSIDLF